MTTTEAVKKACPLDRKSFCEATRCMAWQSTSQDEGFCQMISRSRTMYIASASPALKIDIEEAVKLKTEKPLEVMLVQRDGECLEVPFERVTPEIEPPFTEGGFKGLPQAGNN